MIKVFDDKEIPIEAYKQVENQIIDSLITQLQSKNLSNNQIKGFLNEFKNPHVGCNSQVIKTAFCNLLGIRPNGNEILKNSNILGDVYDLFKITAGDRSSIEIIAVKNDMMISHLHPNYNQDPVTPIHEAMMGCIDAAIDALDHS